MKFNMAFVDQVRQSKIKAGLYSGYWVPDRLLAIDPGETTGWCLFRNGEYAEGDDTRTIRIVRDGGKDKKFVDYAAIVKIFDEYEPDYMTIEDYKVYADKLEQHSYTALHTPNIIGAFEMIAYLRGVPINRYMAGVVKPFWKGKMQTVLFNGHSP